MILFEFEIENDIKEVFFNILKNSIEAINDNGLIEISVSKHKKKMIVEFKDNGIGISKKDLNHVMEPFFSTKKLKANNYGLGLTFSYVVMEKHLGKIEIKSEEKVGTSVVLTFPIM